MGVFRRLRVMGRLLSLYHDFLFGALYGVLFFSPVECRFEPVFPRLGVRVVGLYLKRMRPQISKPALHGKIPVKRQETQKLQPWVTHIRIVKSID